MSKSRKSTGWDFGAASAKNTASSTEPAHRIPEEEFAYASCRGCCCEWAVGSEKCSGAEGWARASSGQDACQRYLLHRRAPNAGTPSRLDIPAYIGTRA